ncbi:four helix bundle protein [Pollutibacter soli]|uniref:four helix bundle protein n=1 Tax=Pollutibacter soli TaxID=3034157 RepID=UPI0030141D40
MNDFSYKRMIVWQKSMQLTASLYPLINKLPSTENFNLCSQLRRATISVSSNIAEGSARKSGAERARFYTIARSSAIEIDSQLESAVLLRFLKESECELVNGLIMEIFKILSKLIIS